MFDEGAVALTALFDKHGCPIDGWREENGEMYCIVFQRRRRTGVAIATTPRRAVTVLSCTVDL